MTAGIRADHLTFKYWGSSHPALADVSLTIPVGGAVGIAGPNGSGKTTFLKLAAGLVRPSRGKIEVSGMDIATHREEISALTGYVPERSATYPYLSGSEFLSMMFELAGGEPQEGRDLAARELRKLGLGSVANQRISSYSFGMARRLVLAQSLMHNPKVLLMDEPFNGLDLRGIEVFRSTLREARTSGKTILLASHGFPEIEDLCDSICVFDHGHLVTHESIEAIRESAAQRPLKVEYRLRFRRHSHHLTQFLSDLPFENRSKTASPVVLVTLQSAPNEFDRLLKILSSSPEEVVSIEPLRSSLEESVYRALESP